MSWNDAFAVEYHRWSAAMTEDVPFYVSLARDADGPVVELAVGSARVATALWRFRPRAVHRRVARVRVHHAQAVSTSMQRDHG
jgi:hypothetical protein